jgi:hypothetical protein
MEQGGNGSEMQQRQYDGGDPSYALAIGQVDDLGGP